MAILKVLKEPNPILRTKSAPVENVTPELLKFMDDMIQTMYDIRGIGLAANQVGKTQRFFVMDTADTRNGEKPNPIKLINPEITWRSDAFENSEEGCLSVPYGYSTVKRHAEIEVTYISDKAKKITKRLDGLDAYCVQHEIDHLDGILFVDRLSPMKRKMILKKSKKNMKLDEN